MSKDPYQYFRIEARELLEGLTRGILDLEKGGPLADVTETVGALLRLAHTLKGASRVVKQTKISELAHSLEEILAPCRDGKSQVPKQLITEMLKAVDAMSAGVASLDPGSSLAVGGGERKAESPQQQEGQPTEEPLETVRVGIAEMDRLLERLSEAGAQLAAIRRDAHAIQHAAQLSGDLCEQLSRCPLGIERSASAPLLTAEELRGSLGRINEGLATGVEQLDAELSQIREAAHQLRLLPASVIFAPLERTARDAAQALKKNVKFEASGGETRLDAHVLAALRDALLHVVRNAVAHGIETAAQRKAAGKPEAGAVRISVERRGNRVAFICRDDGAGIDVAAIRKAAVVRGLLPADKAEAFGLQEVVQLILKGGVTTTEAVTEVSGRGIGLDVVRATAARLKGVVALRTEPGRETSVDICVPISLASLAALRVEAGGMTASIPLDCVKNTMRVGAADLVRAGDGVSIVCDGRSIPFVSLSDLLGKSANGAGSRKSRAAVIVESQQGIAALGVERLLGTANVVLRPLPPSIQAEAFIAGASLDTNGNPELVLDPAGIVAAANTARPDPSATAHPATVRPPILIVDDSLTTRMLEQSILESAGYKVELAVSAEDALEKTHERKHSLFIVDVEMPGMNGFEFVERVQSDPLLREIPCILVTSRNEPEDRMRGKKAGARAYIVKGEFNQDFLLQTIRGLIS